MLVAVGSCAFMEISALAGDDRIAAGVITGIGFLGAGAIVRDGITTRGLTTAASIWTVASIGLALGAGSPASYLIAAAVTIVTLGALLFSDGVLERLVPKAGDIDVWVRFEPERIAQADVIRLFANVGRDVRATDRLTVERQGESAVADWLVVLEGVDRDRLRALTPELTLVPGIRRVAIDDSSPN